MDSTFLLNLFKSHYFLIHIPFGLIIAIIFIDKLSNKTSILLKKLLVLFMGAILVSGLGLLFSKEKIPLDHYVHAIFGIIIFGLSILHLLGKSRHYKITLTLSFISIFSGSIIGFGQKYFFSPLNFSEKEYSEMGIINDDAQKRFHYKIKTIIDKKCIHCHNAITQNGKLNLTSLESILGEGTFHRFYNAGKVEDSGFYLRINENVLSPKHMPFLSGRLSDNEIDLIRKWIYAGGFNLNENINKKKKEVLKVTHWAFKKFRKPTNTFPIGKEIDGFIKKRLDNKKIPKAKIIGDGQLFRKLSLITRGILPSIEEVNSFKINDYEKWVDTFLDSYAFGEKWAAFWLDLFSYAQTSGYTVTRLTEGSTEFKNYIIKSLNDKPSYFSLLKEQVYFNGKEIEDPSYDHKNMMRFFPIHRDPFVTADLAINTITSSTLALEMRCARCHDHKYDPISNEQYYSVLSSLEKTHNMKEISYYKLRKNKGKKIELSFLDNFEGTINDFSFWYEKRSEDKKSLLKNQFIIDDYVNWLTDTQNGTGLFIARVFVDHLWRIVFGKGLVPSTSNFGLSGKEPHYRELLDWLAYDFIENKTSIKYMLKKLLMSKAFRQFYPIEKNSNQFVYKINHLKRLDTESIRDSLLSFSKLLDSTPSEKTIDADPLSLDINKKTIYYMRSREKGNLYSQNLGIPRGYGSVAERNKRPDINQIFFFLNEKYISSLLDVSIKNRIKNQNLDNIINDAYLELFSRNPNKRELISWKSFFKNGKNKEDFKMFYHILISSNEFLYIY